MKTSQSDIHASVGVYRVQGGGISVRSPKCGGVGGLALGWVGIIYRQRTMFTYSYA